MILIQTIDMMGTPVVDGGHLKNLLAWTIPTIPLVAKKITSQYSNTLKVNKVRMDGWFLLI